MERTLLRVKDLRASGHGRPLAQKSMWLIVARWYAWVLVLGVCVFVIGYRDYSVGTDTFRYARIFEWLPGTSIEAVIGYFRGSDIGFYLTSKILAEAFGARGVFVCYALLLGVAILYIGNAVSRKHILVISIIYLGLPAFYSLGVNVLRHGVSVSLLLIGTAFLLKGRYNVSAVWAVIAFTMHASSIIYIAACIIALRISTPRVFILFSIAAVASMADIGLHHIDLYLGVEVVGLLVGDRFDWYMDAAGYNYRTGFRLDFVLYTLAPVLLVWATTRGVSVGLATMAPRRDLLIRIYLVCSAIFFLSFSYPYSDRIGIYAWILIPLIIVGGANNRSGLHRSVWLIGTCVIVLVNLYLLSGG